jgi:acetyl esterase/lipase
MAQPVLTKPDKIYLWDKKIFPLKDDKIDQYAPAIIPYQLFRKAGQTKKLPVMLICPGGGFMYKELYKEGEQIAFMANKLGMSAFVLDYRTAPYAHPNQILDIQRSIRFIRFHAEKYGIDPNRICVIGFSAGGMIAGLAATERPEGNSEAIDPIDRISAKPDAVVLCYAITNLQKMEFFQKLLLGSVSPGKDISKRYNLPSCVDNINCPLFIWTTCNDKSVPSLQSLDMGEQLSKTGKDFEIHIFEEGPHGLSLSQYNGAVAQWIPAMEKWLSRHSFNVNHSTPLNEQEKY